MLAYDREIVREGSLLSSIRMRVTCLLAAFALALLAPRLCVAQYHDLDPELATAAKAYDRAQMQSDHAALERLVADDYLILRPNGTVGDKQSLIQALAGEGQKTDPYTVEKPFQRSYGSTAILGGWVHLTGSDHGKPWVENMRFADTWARRNGKWQVVFTSLALADKP
jgi:hypothetical protein